MRDCSVVVHVQIDRLVEEVHHFEVVGRVCGLVGRVESPGVEVNTPIGLLVDCAQAGTPVLLERTVVRSRDFA